MKKAFTLVELLIVIVIIGILAAIAIPQFEKMVWKARFAEVYNIFGTIAHAEQVYYAEHNHYTKSDFNNCLAGNGIAAGSTQVQKDLGIDVPSGCFFQYLIYPSDAYPGNGFATIYFKQQPYNWAWIYNYHRRVWQRAFADAGPVGDLFLPPAGEIIETP